AAKANRVKVGAGFTSMTTRIGPAGFRSMRYARIVRVRRRRVLIDARLVDDSGIYVADGGNDRIVHMRDMNGTFREGGGRVIAEVATMETPGDRIRAATAHAATCSRTIRCAPRRRARRTHRTPGPTSSSCRPVLRRSERRRTASRRPP